MDQKERDLRIRFSHVEGVGSGTFHDILGAFGSLSKFFRLAAKGSLQDGFKDKAKMWIDKCYEFDIEKWRGKLLSKGIKTLVLGDDDYPFLLSNIHYPPLILYYLGELERVNFNNCISVVGTRKRTEYGKLMTARIVKELALAGFTIVSGMAYGVDRTAHLSTLENEGSTIAVLASSVDDPTPIGNEDIYKRILEKGIVVSETEPGEEYGDFSFPLRNRIIAGLSRATLVVEAPAKSGALITAGQAFEEDRLVFAVPGDVARYNSMGANNLIKYNKAKIVTCAEDIFEELGVDINKKSRHTRLSLNQIQKVILNELRIEPRSVDEIAQIIDMKVSDLLASISELEIKGVVKLNDQMKYILVI